MSRTRSVIVDDMEHCVCCGKEMIQIHHIFYGTANRKLSDQDGYVIPLCHNHHTGKEGIHFNKDMDEYWKQIAQKHYEKHHSRQAFIKRYGRSWL